MLGAKQVSAKARGVRALLDEIALRGGEVMARMLFANPADFPRETHVDLRVLVNGRSIAFLDGLDTQLRCDDTVTLHLSGARGFPGG